MKQMLRRAGIVIAGVLILNVLWNVAGSLAITPNSPAPVVYTQLDGGSGNGNGWGSD